MEDTTRQPPVPLDAEAIATSCRPGSGGWGPIKELGKFYEMLMNRGKTGCGAGFQPASDEEQAGSPRHKLSILSPQSVEALTARHRAGMLDVTFKTPMDWGLGFLLNSSPPRPELPYGFGPVSSPRTFGHGGAQSSGGFCDPERGLVVAYVFNGRPGEERHHGRRKALLAAIEEDLAGLSALGEDQALS
jgi:CubicO group peptidase (beta-lactamase class C family)